jgi:c-di-GMP-related signal transduction protein
MAFGARKPSFTGRPDRAIEITRGPRPPTDQGLAGSDANAVTRIQQVANAESGNLDSLPGEILKDGGLTGKLLRGVNTARYQVACGCIGMVSCAVGLVGFNGIRNLAMRLVPLKHMHDKAHAHPLQEEFLRSLAGQHAGQRTGHPGARPRAGVLWRDAPEPRSAYWA